MKNYFNKFIALLLIGSNAFAGLPPTTATGQAESASVPNFFFQAPNSQFTTTAAATRLLETGNGNTLLNPDFESNTVNAGWTVTNGTPTIDTTNFLNGNQSLLVTLSAQSGTIVYQNVTPTAQVGGQGYEYAINVKTTLTGLTVCALQNSATVGICPSVLSDGNWHTYTVIYPASSVSNGIQVVEASSSTGTINFDTAYVGTVRGISASTLGTITVQRFTASGTYTPPSGVSYIRVREVGAGGGGGAVNSGGTGGTGGSTIFGSYVTCPGGLGGTSTDTGGAGGAACTISAPAVTISSIPGAQGYAGAYSNNSTSFFGGAPGGISPFGNGATPPANTGSGGTGAGATNTINIYSGGGGGSGAYAEFFVPNPTTQTITIGAQGTAATGAVAGSLGYVEVTEYYSVPVLSQNAMFDSTGMIVPTTSATCPAGTLLANGASISTTTYAHYYAVTGLSTVPDLRAQFLRGTGTNGTLTTANGTAYAGPSLNATQNDQLQGHYHAFTYEYTSGGSNTAHVTSSSTTGVSVTGDTFWSVGAATIDGTNGTPRTGNESRPVNYGVNYCVIMNGVLGMPLLIGSVTSGNTSGVQRVEQIRFGGASSPGTNCTTSPCTILSQSNLVASVTRTSTGIYAGTFNTPFSAYPSCVCNATQNGTTRVICDATQSTTTALSVVTNNGSNTLVDSEISVSCTGQK